MRRGSFAAFAGATVVAFGASLASGQVIVGVVNGGAAAGADVVAQLNDDTWFDFQASLLSASDVDTVAEAQQYDVIVLGASGFGNDMGYSSAMLASLRAYYDLGGGVVTTGWWDYLTDHFGGQDALDADYISPIGSTFYGFTFPNPVVDLQNGPHPITDGLSDFSSTPNLIEFSTSVDASAVVLGLANGAVGQNVIVYDDTIGGRSVYLGGLYMANVGSYGTAGMRAGNEDQLLEQAVAWGGGGGGGNYRIIVGGSCPGTVTVDWFNAAPNGQQGIVFAANTGNVVVPNGPCAGTQLGLGAQNIQLVNVIGTGPSGSGSTSGLAGIGVCGGFLQFVQAGSCITSNVDQIP